MIGNFFLPWAQLAASFFSTMLCLWLGFSILLGLERRENLGRSAGAMVAGLGFLAGAFFFAAHTAMLDYSIESLVLHVRAWWYGGWLALVCLPGGWYGLMLWYAGYWDDASSPLRRRHRLWLYAILFVPPALMATVARLDPLRILDQVVSLNASAAQTLVGLAPLVFAYPLYLVLCVWLALDALHRPNPSGRFMGDLARRRARPLLIASTLVHLVTAVLIAGAILYLVLRALRDTSPNTLNRLDFLDWLELLVTTLIGAALVLTGKAIVTYEIFTGSALPRGGFWKQWRRVVMAAAFYSVCVSVLFNSALKPVYFVLVCTLLLCAFMALWSRAAVLEREAGMTALRPFVASGHFLESVLDARPSSRDNSANAEANIALSFRALCDFLDASAACLQASGALAPLVGAPLQLGERDFGAAPNFDSSILCVPIEREGETVLAVPLWSGSRNSGVLFLAPKRDANLYTQEEIEIARAAGERLLDARAAAALGKKLMALQRREWRDEQSESREAPEIAPQRSESNRVRRALHDDVLPQLHTAMLSLSALESEQAQSALNQLSNAHRQISDMLRDLPSSAAPEIARLGLLGALRRAAENELSQSFEEVRWNLAPEAEEFARALPAASGEVLFYAAREAIRNAARYGRGRDEKRALHLTVRASAENGFRLDIEDDGVGLNAGGASQGSGQGLALHSTLMAVIGGSLESGANGEKGTRISLVLPQKYA